MNIKKMKKGKLEDTFKQNMMKKYELLRAEIPNVPIFYMDCKAAL